VRQYGFPFNPRPHCWMTFGSHMSKQELQHVRELERGHSASCPSVHRLPSGTLNPTISSAPGFRSRSGLRPVLGVDAVFS